MCKHWSVWERPRASIASSSSPHCPASLLPEWALLVWLEEVRALRKNERNPAAMTAGGRVGRGKVRKAGRRDRLTDHRPVTSPVPQGRLEWQKACHSKRLVFQKTIYGICAFFPPEEKIFLKSIFESIVVVPRGARTNEAGLTVIS